MSASLSQLLAVARSRPTTVQLHFVATLRGGVHRDSNAQAMIVCLSVWLSPASRPATAQLQFVAAVRGGVHRDCHCEVTHWLSGAQGRGGGGERVAKENRVHRPGVDDDELEVVPARHGRRGQRDAEGG